MLYRAVLPHYVCGFVVEKGVIVEAAPIMAWAVGKTLEQYTAWARKKGGEVELVRES